MTSRRQQREGFRNRQDMQFPSRQSGSNHPSSVMSHTFRHIVPSPVFNSFSVNKPYDVHDGPGHFSIRRGFPHEFPFVRPFPGSADRDNVTISKNEERRPVEVGK